MGLTCPNASLLFMEVPSYIKAYVGESISVECLASLTRCRYTTCIRKYCSRSENNKNLFKSKTLAPFSFLY